MNPPFSSSSLHARGTDLSLLRSYVWQLKWIIPDQLSRMSQRKRQLLTVQDQYQVTPRPHGFYKELFLSTSEDTGVPCTHPVKGDAVPQPKV